MAPSVWLSCYWWGVVGLDSAYKGTTLKFRVVLDFGGIVCEGLPSGVGLPFAALNPSFLDKRVGTGPASA